MSEEAKTYVFGNSDSQFAPLMAAMNNGGFGGNSWWVISDCFIWKKWIWQ